ncbi:MAG: hypothetical protein MK101_10205 [Phycisphaerales bacterium]|nr:hypothetical protein [Phycisphaerales bacterium]
MEPPYRIRSDLQRVIDRGHAFALGIAGGGARPPAHGWFRIRRAAEGEMPPSMTWTIVTSHEFVRPLVMEFFRFLPDMVTGIMELGSRDAFRAVDVFLSRKPIDRDRFRGAWDLFESLLLEEPTLAVGVNGDSPFIEVFIDIDKRVIVHAHQDSAPEIESVLRRFGLERRSETELMVPDALLDQVQLRPILIERQSLIVDTDHLLMDLRAVWDLELDEDPDRNLDMQGREIGRTLWTGVVYMDQEDVAGRREAHGHFWGVAASRREMEDLVVEFIESEGEWELLDVVGLDRAAFDDRPEQLDALAPSLPRRGVLLWRVEIAGTVQDWGEDERF